MSSGRLLVKGCSIRSLSRARFCLATMRTRSAKPRHVSPLRLPRVISSFSALAFSSSVKRASNKVSSIFCQVISSPLSLAASSAVLICRWWSHITNGREAWFMGAGVAGTGVGARAKRDRSMLLRRSSSLM